MSFRSSDQKSDPFDRARAPAHESVAERRKGEERGAEGRRQRPSKKKKTQQFFMEKKRSHEREKERGRRREEREKRCKMRDGKNRAIVFGRKVFSSSK